MPNGGSFSDPGPPPVDNSFAAPPAAGPLTRTGRVELTADASGYSQTMTQAGAATAQLSGHVGNLLTRIDNLFKAGGRSLKILSTADVASLGAATASAAGLQSSMSTLSATAAVTGESYGRFSHAVDNSFSKFAQHRGDVVALVTQLTELGTKDRDVSSVAASVTKLGEASGESIPALAQNLLQLNRSMGNTTARDVANYANSVLTVSRNAGVGVNNVLSFAQSIAPIARQANIGESAVLGISTAFTKAGADGFSAANTFNSIVNDITTLSRTGSPELAKYASFIGKTVDQFRKMPAKDQITGIFDAIAKGGPQALNFVNELGLGTRSLTAVQAVAQSGGLGKYISDAQAASTGTANLDKGASAAQNNLDSQLTLLHNQLTRFVDMLGGPLLTPLTAVVHGFAVGASILNKAVSLLGPLPTVLGAILAPIGMIAGVALAHAPLIGAVAGVRMLGRAGTTRAYTEGRITSSMIGAGTAESAALGATATGRAMSMSAAQREAQGVNAPNWRTYPFWWAGRGVGKVAPLSEEGIARVESGAATPSVFARGSAAVAKAGTKATVGLSGLYFAGQTRAIEDSTKADYARSAYRGTALASESGAGAATARAAKALDTSAGAITVMGRGAIRVTEDMAKLGFATAKAGVVMTGQAAAAAGSGLTGRLAAGGMGSQLLGRTLGGAGALAGAAFSLPGLLALTVGLPLMSSLSSKIKAQDNSGLNVAGSYNAISHYDNLLGQSSTNLADFASKVSAAGDKLAGLPDVSNHSLPDVAHITDADRAKAGANYKVTDPGIASLSQRNPHDTHAAVAYLQTLSVQKGGMDPKTLRAIKEDLIASYGPATAQTILNAYVGTPGAGGATGGRVNYAAIGGAARSAYGDPGDYKNIVGQGVSGAKSQAQVAPGKRSNAAQAGAVLQTLASSLTGLNSDQANNSLSQSAATFLNNTFGTKIDPEHIAPTRSNSNLNDDLINARYKSTSGLEKSFLSNVLSEDAGRKFLASAGIDVSKHAQAQPGYLDSVLSQLNGATFPGPTASQSNVTLRGGGALGLQLSRSGLFQAATSDASGDAGKTQQAIEQAADAAMKLSRDSSAASAGLQKLADATGGTAGQLLAAAAQWVRTLQQNEVMPYLSQGGQGHVLARNLQTSRAAYQAAGAPKSGATTDQYKADLTAFDQYQAAQTSRLQEMGRALDQFHTSQVRGEQAYELSVERSNRNFQIAMQQSEEDYYRQRSRTIADFNLQQARSAQAAAESIYNPFARVQAQQVVNGGMLAGNLEDQNRRIEQQQRQVAQLRAAGMSQAAIDTLQLDNPANAQQTNAIAQSVLHDPKTLARINQLVATRQRATTGLVQSQYNEEFRNTVSDFERGLHRTEQEYDTAQKRAVAAQNRSLGDMATDFNTSVKQAGEDLTTQMTELYGNFATVYTNTLGKINKDIGRSAPELARVLGGIIRTINNDVNAANGGGGGGGSNAGTLGAPGTQGNPISTAGTYGQNPAGKYGYYDKGGKFHNTGWDGTKGPSAPNIAPPGSSAARQGGNTLASEIKAAGFRGDAARIMYGIVMAESGGNRFAHNYNDATRDDSYGLAQLNLYGPLREPRMRAWGLSNPNQLYDASRNLRIAYNMSGGGSHFGDWTTYTSGAYLAGMPAKGQYGLFTGGVVTKRINADLGEHGTEAVVPLSGARGLNFMADFYDKVSAALAVRMPTSGLGLRGQGSGGGGGGSVSMHEDNRTFYTGDIKLSAEDPAAMERKLAARARLKRLAGQRS